MKHVAPISLVRLIFSLVLFFLGVFLFLDKGLYGLILLGPAIRLGMREGIEIDLDTKRFRKLYWVFAIEFGKWKPIPKIDYVSVFRTTQKTRARVLTAQALASNEVFKVNLFYLRNKHIEAYITESIDDAFKVGNQMALALDTEVYDATQE